MKTKKTPLFFSNLPVRQAGRGAAGSLSRLFGRVIRRKAWLLLFTFCFLLFKSQAQTFQWGIRGGSASLTQNPYESVTDMATDPAGNVYELSMVGQLDLNVDGYSKTNYGGQDILLSSFSCDGTYRWSKDIGGYTDDQPIALKTDSIGGVYVTGELNLNSLTPNGHIDTDTTLSDYTKKQLFLLKFDTAGTYKWLVMPQADSIGFASILNTSPIDMDVDGAGNIYWLCTLAPGAYDNGTYIIDSQAAYILRYSKDGFYQTNIKLDLHYVTTGIDGMKIRHSDGGKYYCAGSLGGGALNIGGYQLSKPMYVCAFSNTGQALWVKQNASVNSQLLGRLALSNTNDIYITGDVSDNDTMCGLNFTNAPSIPGMPFIMDIDSNGTGLWVKCANGNGGSASDAVAMKNDDEIIISGHYPGSLSWPGYSVALNQPFNSGYDIFTTRFNSHTGQVLGMDSIASDFGEDEFPASMTADSKGNVYIGGQFVSQMYIANDTLQSIGGETDFFVAKYGFANCTCTATPTANYSYATAGGGVVNFTYTGATPYDSLQWSFGDGGTSATANPSHTYTTTTGTYYACVTVFNSCGSGTYCDTVRPDLGVMPLNGMDNISVYPNPTNSNLTLTLSINGEGTYNVALINVYGQVVLRQNFSGRQTVLDIKGLANGVYFIQLTNKDGERKVIRVVKE